MKRVIIIGGGASGIVCGILAKRVNNQVTVLERNTAPLKKLLMTGNGKCNYFNEVFNKNCYHSDDIDIVEKIISTENLDKVLEFFDSLGIVPKIKNGYYYPFSQQASTIREVLLNKALEVGVDIVCNTLVTDIERDKYEFIVSTDSDTYKSDFLVLACGSRAYPKTGSDGMGYSFLDKFHHTIIKPVPALVQLIGKGNFKDWDGVRSDVSLELFEDGEFIAREEGEIQLTSYGISGICTFNLSHFVSRGLDVHKKEEIHINFVPFIDTLVTPWMDKYAKKLSNRNLIDLLSGFLNHKLALVIIKKSGLNDHDYYLKLSNEEKLRLCKNLRSFSIEIEGTKDFDSCQICNGGLKLTEIDPCTMISNKVSNLYVIGELLDMNGNCGGYNLTTCWISGILAGESIGDMSD